MNNYMLVPPVIAKCCWWGSSRKWHRRDTWQCWNSGPSRKSSTVWAGIFWSIIPIFTSSRANPFGYSSSSTFSFPSCGSDIYIVWCFTCVLHFIVLQCHLFSHFSQFLTLWVLFPSLWIAWSKHYCKMVNIRKCLLTSWLQTTTLKWSVILNVGYQLNSSSTNAGDPPRVEFPSNVQGLRTPEALSIVLRHVQRLLSGQAVAALSVITIFEILVVIFFVVGGLVLPLGYLDLWY